MVVVEELVSHLQLDDIARVLLPPCTLSEGEGRRGCAVGQHSEARERTASNSEQRQVDGWMSA